VRAVPVGELTAPGIGEGDHGDPPVGRVRPPTTRTTSLASGWSTPRSPWLVVGTVCIGAFIGQLDASIVSIALPAIGRDLGGSTGQVDWVALSYLLTLVALVAPIGRLADSVGRKLLYT
jgi:hypothetical protein